MEGREIARTAALLADDKKGLDLVIYDLRGLSDVTDYFVIVTAQSKLQSRAIAAAVEKGLRDLGVRKMSLEGNADSRWVLLDYGPVVVHIFSADLREYYSLESLWGDAPKVKWNDGAPVPAVVPSDTPKSHKPFAHG
jgi:ribosome-associated protein